MSKTTGRRLGPVNGNIAGLIDGNLTRHKNAKHDGEVDTKCNVCTGHQEALRRELEALKQ